MKLRIHLLGDDKKPRVIELEVPSEYEAQVRWNSIMERGIFVENGKRFYPPTQIKYAEIVD